MAGTSATCSWTPWPPGGGEVDRRVVGEVAGCRAVGVHRVDFRVAVAVALEGDLGAVGRPDGGAVEMGRVVGDIAKARAVRVDHVDLVAVIEGDLSPVRRPRGVKGRSHGRELGDERPVRIYHADLYAAAVRALQHDT